MKVRAEVEKIATQILKEGLPQELCFHNYQHTLDVVIASGVIGRRCGLSPRELELVQTAAWLHDLGHAIAYQGHEAASKGLALRLLRRLKADPDEIALILGCIEATRMPQKPKNLLEQVVCDADLAHLARSCFQLKCQLLRKEWEIVLGKVFTDRSWSALNLRFLTGHQYWTPYGKKVLTVRKNRNIEMLLSRCGIGTQSHSLLDSGVWFKSNKLGLQKRWYKIFKLSI